MIPYDKEGLIEYLRTLGKIKAYKKRNDATYLNIAASFDIETTNFEYRGEKRAIMYIWQFGIQDYVIYGRTWDAFLDMLATLRDGLHLDQDRRLYVWIHNLSFEFQFFNQYLSWGDVFAVDDRKPVTAHAADFGVVFRDSQILSNMSLASIGKNLVMFPVEKKTGDLDYKLMRHSGTVLTEKELGYCENDVRVLLSYIKEKIHVDGNIVKIPLTNTGYVRHYCKTLCFFGTEKPNHHKGNRNVYINYQRLMRSLQMPLEVFLMAHLAFMGGLVHANLYYVDKICYDMYSLDEVSAYPTQMVAQAGYPMTAGEKIEIKDMADFEFQISHYACLFDIEFVDISSNKDFERVISISKCRNCENAFEDNGRLISADRITMTITEQDFFIYRDFYDWGKIRIGRFYRFERGYLPTDFVKSILTLYARKTQLKGTTDGNPELEMEYMLVKGQLNSAYGMAVTNPCRETTTFTSGQWTKVPEDISDQLKKHNESKNRFLFYLWGVWVTAFARRALTKAILACGNDYRYSDTDSVKIVNYEIHKAWFDKYNAAIGRQLRRACEYHGLDPELVAPKNSKGVPKPLGIFEIDDKYKRAKFLGAKRYMAEHEDGTIGLTVSGVNKRAAVPWMQWKYGDKIFDAFTEGLVIPATDPEYLALTGVDNPCGKLTHTYSDATVRGILIDYSGKAGNYEQRGFVHLENAGYSLTLSQEYSNILRGVKDISF